MKTILVIDDDADLKIYLKTVLSPLYKVVFADNGQQGLVSATENKPDLIVMDLGLPDISGYELCNQIRAVKELEETPIVVLSAKTGANAHTMAYKLGADNYLEKPFEKDELLAMVESRLKKSNKKINQNYGDIEIDLRSFTVTKKGQKMDLTPKEFKILCYLLDHLDEVVSRERILNSVWEGVTVTDRVIDNHITSLRKKISDSSLKIESVYSEGYKITHLK